VTFSAGTAGNGRAVWRPKSPKMGVELLLEAHRAESGSGTHCQLFKLEHHRGETAVLPFKIDDYTAWRLLEGLDDIALTLRKLDEIESFEAAYPEWKPRTLPTS